MCEGCCARVFRTKYMKKITELEYLCKKYGNIAIAQFDNLLYNITEYAKERREFVEGSNFSRGTGNEN